MKGQRHRHVHAECRFCDWEMCPGDRMPLEMSGFYVIHVIDAHWEFVQRVHATTGDTEARMRLIEYTKAELIK